MGVVGPLRGAGADEEAAPVPAADDPAVGVGVLAVEAGPHPASMTAATTMAAAKAAGAEAG